MESNRSATGEVITFYSYKGGTGRSMALANVASLLAKRQRESSSRGVLVIDWDLEAPGLHYYFSRPELSRNIPPPHEQNGLIDLFLKLNEISRDLTSRGNPGPDIITEELALEVVEQAQLKDYIRPTQVPGLDLMQAGRFDAHYAPRVMSFDWESFYHRVPMLFRILAERLAREYAYVLIDSRTGETDISGICTTLMPDKLVIVFVSNQQSLRGMRDVIRRATTYRLRSDDLRPLIVFPLVSRIEMSELRLREQWRFGDLKEGIEGFQTLLQELFKQVYDLPECNLRPYFDEVEIQHVPYYSYGERIAVLDERSKSRLSLTRSFENFTDRLIGSDAPWELASRLTETDSATLKPVDLFLSYNSQDRAAVQQVRTLLRSRGVSVFYDRESLGLGLNWFEPLERALGRVRGVVVLLGPNGLGRWQRREMALALDRQTREATFPVIPVLLPGSLAGDYSGLLLLNNYADIRGGLNDLDTLDSIMRAMRGPATGEEARTISPTEAAAICPYRGLNAFREEDALLFFGRDRLVDEPKQGLLNKVLTYPLVAVVGASGSGKTSVVRAGLLPRLRREPPSRGTWDAVVFWPGKYPFLNLAMALEAVRNPEAGAEVRETDAAVLCKSWSSGELPLDLALGRVREALRVDRLLVVVDQFEELITLTPKDDRLPFLSRLLAATEAESKITVLLTLRADYYSAIYLDPRLSDGIQRGLVNVGAMTRDERRSAIEGPARRVGLEFEPGLVDRLLDDAGDEPGNLPLLEFVLTELWERREGRRLTNAAYERLGGVAEAIGRRAEAVFARLPMEQQAAAPRLFGRLVRVATAGEERADTRQRVRLGDLDEASHSAIERFVADRLLVIARDPSPSTAETNPDNGPVPSAFDDPTTVEIAHEALIHRWERLQGWIKEDRAFLLWRQRLGFLIAEWERFGRDAGALFAAPT